MEFGHAASNAGGFHIDRWGVGNFVICDDAGKLWRFEDSDRFGPSLIKKNGDIAKNPWPPEKSPFWRAHRIWRRQGRRVAEDKSTCIWDEPRPMVIRRIGGKHYEVIDGGEEDGRVIKQALSSDERTLPGPEQVKA